MLFEEWLDVCDDESKVLLRDRLVEREELNEVEAEVIGREKVDNANDELLVTNAEPVSSEFQGPERIGSDNEV